MTPIRLVQMYVDVPMKGDNIREPMISKTISNAPQTNTVSSRIKCFGAFAMANSANVIRRTHPLTQVVLTKQKTRNR